MIKIGVIGCGNIGAIAAKKAKGIGMNVIAFDPFLTEERANEIGVEKVELDELLNVSDFITLHVPLTDKTKNILNKESFRPISYNMPNGIKDILLKFVKNFLS